MKIKHNIWYVAMLITAVLLYLADWLTSSVYLRIAAGLFLLIAIFAFYPRNSNKKTEDNSES